MNVDGHIATMVVLSLRTDDPVTLKSPRIVDGWSGDADDPIVTSPTTGKVYQVHLQGNRLNGEWKHKALEKIKAMLPEIEAAHEQGKRDDPG